MSKIKVLEIINNLGVGGANRTLQTFCRYLNKERFDVSVATVFEGGKRAEELQQEGFGVHIFQGNLVSLKDYLARSKFDILHIHRRGAFEPHWLVILKDKPAGLVVETNVFAEFDSQTQEYIDIHLFKSMMMLNERYISNLSEEERVNFWPKYRVLYNPVDIDYFMKFKLPAAAVSKRKSELGIKNGEYVIGKVGARAAIEKWSDLVTDMLPYLIKEVPNVKLILQAAPIQIITKLKGSKFADKIIFCPETEDEAEQAAYYQILDVFVHSSKIGEAFGNTLNEAMVWQKPIVVNSTPWADNGQLEQVEHNKNGFIASSPRSFAAAVLQLLKNQTLAESFGDYGFRKVKREYLASQIVNNLEQLFLNNVNFDYFPSKNQILTYKDEYQDRCRQDYLPPTLSEKLFLYYIPVVRRCVKSLIS